MAEAIGEARPRGVQHLPNDARWDPDAVRVATLREYVLKHPGDEIQRRPDRRDESVS